MGEKGEKVKKMRSQRTNIGPVKPEPEKLETQNSIVGPVTPHKPAAHLGREVQARIGQQLRAMYDEYVKEGVPPHITDLVRRLSEQD